MPSRKVTADNHGTGKRTDSTPLSDNPSPPATPAPARHSSPPQQPTTIRAALHLISQHWLEQVDLRALTLQSAEKYIQIAERFARYCAAEGVTRLDEVTDEIGLAFVRAPGRNRHGVLVPVPADSTSRGRRSAVDAFFAQARRLGLTVRVPMIDLQAIPRSAPRPSGRLTDRDLDDLRFHAERGMPRTRYATVLALLIIGLHSGEIGSADTADLDVEHIRIWASGGARITARYCPLDDSWAREAIQARAEYLRGSRTRGHVHALATERKARPSQQQSSVCTAFAQIVRASSVIPGGHSATPRDVTCWLAAKVFAQSGQLADVALRLGCASLDRAATLAGYTWRPVLSADVI
jgi:integrase